MILILSVGVLVQVHRNGYLLHCFSPPLPSPRKFWPEKAGWPESPPQLQPHPPPGPKTRWTFREVKLKQMEPKSVLNPRLKSACKNLFQNPCRNSVQNNLCKWLPQMNLANWSATKFCWEKVRVALLQVGSHKICCAISILGPLTMYGTVVNNLSKSSLRCIMLVDGSLHVGSFPAWMSVCHWHRNQSEAKQYDFRIKWNSEWSVYVNLHAKYHLSNSFPYESESEIIYSGNSFHFNFPCQRCTDLYVPTSGADMWVGGKFRGAQVQLIESSNIMNATLESTSSPQPPCWVIGRAHWVGSLLTLIYQTPFRTGNATEDDESMCRPVCQSHVALPSKHWCHVDHWETFSMSWPPASITLGLWVAVTSAEDEILQSSQQSRLSFTLWTNSPGVSVWPWALHDEGVTSCLGFWDRLPSSLWFAFIPEQL